MSSTAPEPPAVSVLIVTYNCEQDLTPCLAAVAAQSYRPLDLVIVDCDSKDRSVEVARSAPAGNLHRTVHPLGQNLGFAGGMNAGLQLTDSPYVLALNADALPQTRFVQRLIDRAQKHPSSAAVTGRLLRLAQDDESSETRIDACGMRLTRTWRHLDRESGEIDHGQLDRPERVFGATGAATLYRRAALDDVAIPIGDGKEGETHEIFDSLFHSYREDAELCFRFQERGWDVIYEPLAIAEHRRRVLPKGRSALPKLINYHSLKNRYLLRAYHQTLGNALRTSIPTLWRDLLAIGWVLLKEHSTLPAYAWLWSHRREILRRRRAIQHRKTIPNRDLDHWFSHSALPLPISESNEKTPSSYEAAAEPADSPP